MIACKFYGNYSGSCWLASSTPMGMLWALAQKMRANAHSLLPLGALRRRKERVGLV